MHVRAGARGPVVRVAEVVLHVAVAQDVVGQWRALELREDHLVGLLKHVRQHVEPPAMRHAQHDLGHLQPRRLLHQRVEQRHERLAALQREALLPGVARLEELLEHLRGDEPLEHRAALVGAQLGMVAPRLHALLQPFARAARAALERRPVHDAVEVALAEAELR